LVVLTIFIVKAAGWGMHKDLVFWGILWVLLLIGGAAAIDEMVSTKEMARQSLFARVSQEAAQLAESEARLEAAKLRRKRYRVEVELAKLEAEEVEEADRILREAMI
jgi:hypothetical protein